MLPMPPFSGAFFLAARAGARYRQDISLPRPSAAAGARGHRRRPSSPRGSTTMKPRTRRVFCTDVGKGMVVASVGSTLAADLGLSAAFADDGPETLTFGPLE